MNGYSNERMFKMSEQEIIKNYLFADENTVSAIKENQPDDDVLYNLADLYKIFGDSTRIKILYVLFEHELCVNDIAAILNMTSSAISHQLRVLKQSHLVSFRRQGKTLFYFLADEHVRIIIEKGLEHICE